eukprot:Clim_evm32s231 gene=Clim_evmTU32s231
MESNTEGKGTIDALIVGLKNGDIPPRVALEQSLANYRMHVHQLLQAIAASTNKDSRANDLDLGSTNMSDTQLRELTEKVVEEEKRLQEISKMADLHTEQYARMTRLSQYVKDQDDKLNAMAELLSKAEFRLGESLVEAKVRLAVMQRSHKNAVNIDDVMRQAAYSVHATRPPTEDEVDVPLQGGVRIPYYPHDLEVVQSVLYDASAAAGNGDVEEGEISD